MTQLEYTEENLVRVMRRDKWITFRVRNGQEEIPDPGEVVELVDDMFGEVWTDALVEWTTTMTVEQFARREWEGHRDYINKWHAAEQIGVYYPDMKVTPETEGVVICHDIDNPV